MDEEPTIPGGRCRACGHIFAPAQSYGCERCGAHGEALEEAALPARGRVAAAAVVHVHRSKSPVVPFGVAEVALDAGPVIRVLAENVGAGSRVVRGVDGPDDLPRFVNVKAPTA